MTTQQGIAVRESSEALESIRELEDRFAIAVRQRDLLATYIKERLTPGKHFYQVGSSKNSLTKEGAELICLPHGYKPAYTIESGPSQPPEDATPYQITVRCTLRKGDVFEGEGLGSASSHHTTKADGRVVRQPDIGLRHNATLKMAQKSAYIAATLNATAASEFFTQDMEDGAETTETKAAPTDNRFWCAEHKTEWFKRGKMPTYAHPIGDTKVWCNMKDARLDAKDKQDWTEGDHAAEEAETTPPVSQEAPSAPVRHAGKDITPQEWQNFYDWMAKRYDIEKPEDVHFILGKRTAEWTGTLRDAAALIQSAKESNAK